MGVGHTAPDLEKKVLIGMCVGEERRAYVPNNLVIGPAGFAKTFRGALKNESFTFEVEIVSINGTSDYRYLQQEEGSGSELAGHIDDKAISCDSCITVVEEFWYGLTELLEERAKKDPNEVNNDKKSLNMGYDDETEKLIQTLCSTKKMKREYKDYIRTKCDALLKTYKKKLLDHFLDTDLHPKYLSPKVKKFCSLTNQCHKSRPFTKTECDTCRNFALETELTMRRTLHKKKVGKEREKQVWEVLSEVVQKIELRHEKVGPVLETYEDIIEEYGPAIVKLIASEEWELLPMGLENKICADISNMCPKSDVRGEL
ncbi:hypothetical protein CYMTET_7661 [Cymbomonas tetramitiformis]|uniref:peptidylprolyl isomerase n=1 Tax=Cymbomonas tetramitiformis TaxID=36881 RepID=A0AAE0LGN9_9CHLO|nr:hypothetical protein CYMTET_7661 [Cymbomonas tetramitiformis]